MSDNVLVKPQPVSPVTREQSNTKSGRSKSILVSNSEGASSALHLNVDAAMEESKAEVNDEEVASAKSNFVERLGYHLENSIASNPSVPFYLLFLVCVLSTLLFASLWYLANSRGDAKSVDYEAFGKDSFNDSVYFALNILLAAGYEDFTDVNHNAVRIVHFCCLLTGLVLFAILIGFITDSVTSYMEELSSGRSKVCESEHTLVLGWNEATARVVVQTAFLRRQYQIMNEEKSFQLPITLRACFPFSTY